MRSRDLDEAPLLALEAAAAPLALVGAVLAVAVGGLLSAGIRHAGDRLGVGATTVDVATGAVAAATLLALAAAAGLAVEYYRQRFRRTGGGTQLLVALFVPALGVAVPLALSVPRLDGLEPPWWLLVPAAVAAHAVALRTVAMYSTSGKHRLRGSAVGTLVGLPTAAALVWIGTDLLPAGALSDAGGRVAEWVVATGLPRHGLLLVAAPLLVGGAYGGYRARTAPEGSTASIEASLPRSPTLPEPSRVPDTSLRGAAVHVRERARHVPVLGRLPGARTSGESASGAGSGDGSSRPPVSARASGGGRSGRSGGGSRSSRGSSGSSGGSSGSSDGSSNSSSRSGRSASGSSRSGSGSSASDGGGSGDRGHRGVRRIGSGGGGSSGASGSSSGASAGSSGGSSGGSGASGGAAGGSGSGGGGDADEGTGSDTRIFTGDFGQYGDGGDTVDRCPACEESIPSDGVYTFCPFCGEQL